MKIAQVSTVASPVRRGRGGSVEQLVWLLTRELTKMGHEVVVFGAAGSETDGETVVTLPGPYASDGTPSDWELCEWINLCRAVEHSRDFDVLHSHAYLWGMPLERVSPAPFVHTLHVLPNEDEPKLWALTGDPWVTAISKFQWAEFPECEPVAVIPHAVDEDAWTFRAEPDDYLLFLGRFIPGKGPLPAIEIARQLGMRLVMAGPVSPYFRQHVEPLIDGRMIEHVGVVSGAERDRLVGGARALLYPIQYPEPFGLVLIEAMTCGTPVLALNKGAVPEIVDDGITGRVVETTEELISVAPQVFGLDRARVRRHALDRFSSDKMARSYLSVYERRIAAAPDSRSLAG